MCVSLWCRGAAPGVVTVMGSTALMIAAASGDLAIVQAMLAHSTKVDILPQRGSTRVRGDRTLTLGADFFRWWSKIGCLFYGSPIPYCGACDCRT